MLNIIRTNLPAVVAVSIQALVLTGMVLKGKCLPKDVYLVFLVFIIGFWTNVVVDYVRANGKPSPG